MFTQTAEYYDKIYSFKDYKGEAAYVVELIRRHRPSARSLLDVACGTGKHLEHLRKHYRADGIEILPAFCRIARRRNRGARIFQGDMADIRVSRRYDVVVCLFSSIGYVRTLSRLGKAIASMAGVLAPGGVLIVEPWFTPTGWKNGRVSAVLVDEPGLKLARITTSKTLGGQSVLEMHYLLATARGTRYTAETHRLGLFSPAQMKAAFRSVGLQVSYDRKGPTGRGLYVGWN